MTITYGHRLIIPGTLFGVLFLSIFLYLVSATLPFTDALAAQPAITSRSQLTIAGATGNTRAEELPVPAPIGGDCQVSEKYPEKIRQWCDLITHYALEHGLDPNLVAALIWQESGGNPVAYSKSGAVGVDAGHAARWDRRLIYVRQRTVLQRPAVHRAAARPRIQCVLRNPHAVEIECEERQLAGSSESLRADERGLLLRRQSIGDISVLLAISAGRTDETGGRPQLTCTG